MVARKTLKIIRMNEQTKSMKQSNKSTRRQWQSAATAALMTFIMYQLASFQKFISTSTNNLF